MRILLDENLLRKLVEALRAERHIVKSVLTQHRAGIDNGALYELAIREYDLCFTRDAGFAHNARQRPSRTAFKLLRVILPQQNQDEFVREFSLVSAPRIGPTTHTVPTGRRQRSIEPRTIE